ncbi:LacI family DNA-binding transcriptional regulator [Devosia naphthalenivorans]|uniref:LacI family DNA-binding transcriptional regulator n=1 Tax=Devosia naphthalenivorans TaxID=2082392 RepID=UPI000D3B666A|nr:LacI family DNA-binding transcriptional regulator [Devosia naphthalenivorans]
MDHELSEKAPTIQDVARIAKVSTATVSRALSRPERVTEATRERVSEAVRVTGYTLNQSARSLRLQSARTILVALPDIGNPFFSTILDAIEREAARRGYGVLVANRFARGDTDPLRDYFLSNRADGLLLLDGSIDRAQLEALTRAPTSLPLIVACEAIADAPFHTVRTDNAYAAEQATRHLLRLGHSRIGHIKGPAGNVLTAEREAGFLAALCSAGAEIRAEWVLHGGFSMDDGARAARTMLDLQERPTAIFATNDEAAIGFISEIARSGLICPRDMSVIGFDDLGIAEHFLPPLTTMRQPREALGRLAAEALIDLIEGAPGKRVPRQFVLSSQLIVRGSTAPPRPR